MCSATCHAKLVNLTALSLGIIEDGYQKCQRAVMGLTRVKATLESNSVLRLIGVICRWLSYDSWQNRATVLGGTLRWVYQHIIMKSCGLLYFINR